MSRPIILIPTDTRIKLIGTILGILNSEKNTDTELSVFEPFNNLQNETDPLQKKSFIHSDHSKKKLSPNTILVNHLDSFLKSGQIETFVEKVIILYYQYEKDKQTNKNHIILIPGLQNTHKNPYALAINYKIASALNSEIIFVTDVDIYSCNKLQERIAILHSNFSNKKNIKITGVIINAINTQSKYSDHIYSSLTEINQYSNLTHKNNINIKKLCTNGPIPVLGYIPWTLKALAPRALDVCNYLKANIINEGAISSRQITLIKFYSGTLINILPLFRRESLLVISSDRLDLLVTCCLAEKNNREISAILLTGRDNITTSVQKICKETFQDDLPVFQIKKNNWKNSLDLTKLTIEKLSGNIQIIKNMTKYITRHLTTKWISTVKIKEKKKYGISPSEFCDQLDNLARKANKRIILPEGEEVRTMKAASISAQRGIATCILLGDPNKIQSIARKNNIHLNEKIEIINPENIRKLYINRLVELRHTKGMDSVIAKKQLMNNIMLGTMMLESGAVDGLVAGTLHTTADTLRPALQIIKKKVNNLLVSSIFFMLLPEQVLIYGDCAVNTNPNPEQLADIAIQSANSALTFGIEPKVAMISYSTGLSGSGPDVEKVREATSIVKKKCPHLIIDGPLQYDAAVVSDIAQSKAPNSPVAGQATVLIFPDLNTGNTTYKAVQRTACIDSIGPILQGMKKPVNDLSRGALINDIIYTIAVTAIQSSIKYEKLC
ncbi:Phosphate acetyltransferase [Candidatus Erwinia haradaeae]|uniref:Phosphate acetyltransferase n=1 Tax=Candidatus Erwinia haradaeae TaxID=1922217 RepID=A0A451CZ74_9GAMM|nr:phosphate acetyltransferase [Candidatus Erwinia haradaeae]VFP78487.1 Phosphate acetyltransferase [Candidatus Erwinia haradaeae]